MVLWFIYFLSWKIAGLKKVDTGSELVVTSKVDLN